MSDFLKLFATAMAFSVVFGGFLIYGPDVVAWLRGGHRK